MLSWDKATYDVYASTYWSTELPDGSKFDLVEDGGEKLVDYADRFDFVRKSFMARLTSTKAQCEAIKRGICAVVPQAVFNIANYEDLETWVCGSSGIDIELLKEHVTYDQNNENYKKDSPLIQNFWKVLESFSEDEQRKFI